MIKSWSIRWKLTVWYVAALLVILVTFGGLMTAMISRQLHRQIDAELVEEANELAEEVGDLRSIDEIRAAFERHYAVHGGFSFQISRADGTVICGSPWLRSHSLPSDLFVGKSPFGILNDITLSHLGPHRILCRRLQGSTEPLVLHVLVPYVQLQRGFQEFLQILFIAGFAAILVACVGGLLIARRALSPLERIINAAERISTENLSTSITVENSKDELGRLAATLNNTFKRLRESHSRTQQFTADAAHELRTPLSVLRTRLDVADRLPIDVDQYRDTYRIAIEQTEKMTKLIDQLLVLSRQDAGLSTSLFDEVLLKPLIKDVVEVLEPAALAKGISVTIDEIPNCTVNGDDISLSRVFFNLIENAIKYTLPGGRVQVNGSCGDHQVQLRISDTGMGIESSHLSKVFDRFYRIDPSRNGQTGGAGLGLAICRSIVEFHHGEVSVSSIVGQGTTFTVVLPLVAASLTSDTFMEEEHAQSCQLQAGR